MEVQLFFNHLHYSNYSWPNATHMLAWLRDIYISISAFNGEKLYWRFVAFGERQLHFMLWRKNACHSYFSSPTFFDIGQNIQSVQKCAEAKIAPFLPSKKNRCLFLLMDRLNTHLRSRTINNPKSINKPSACFFLTE